MSVALIGNAADIDFTYAPADADGGVLGYKKKETYDVAIKVFDPSLTGSKITGFTVTLPVKPEAVSGVSGWMSTELKLENKVNIPDICTKSASVADGVLNVAFDVPVALTAEGLYVGYSFTVDELGEAFGSPDAPIYAVKSTDNLEYGLWVHSSRTRLKWTNLANIYNAVSDMTVHLQANFGANDVAVIADPQYYMVIGKNSRVAVNIVNHSANTVNTIGYNYEIGDIRGEGTATLAKPLEGMMARGSVDLDIAAVNEFGKYPFKLNLTTVDGKPNTDPVASMETVMNVWPSIPVNRPVVDEYTGLGCGWCPRGYVAMEEMKKALGNRWIGMAYHSSDYENAMCTVLNRDFPVRVSGFPNADINRFVSFDPSLIPMRWEDYAKGLPIVDVQVQLEWGAEGTDEAIAHTQVTFMEDVDAASYRLAIGFTGDGLENEEWKQSNYYSGKTEGDGVESDLWDIFLKGANKVTGLVFNDVVVYFKDINGIEGALPEEIKAGETYEYDYKVDFAEFKNLYGEDFINKGARISANAMVLETNGRTYHPINANRSNSLPFGYSGVKGIEASDADVVSSEFVTLDGVRSQCAGKGLMIRIDRLSDGTTKTSKVVVK